MSIYNQDIFDFDLEIYVTHWLVDYKTVNRTWRERLFTLPWRPLIKIKQIKVPSENVIKIGNTLYVHPVLYEKLKYACKEESKVRFDKS